MKKDLQDLTVLYGRHACIAALQNPKRKIRRTLVTKNAQHKLQDILPANIEIVDDRTISKNLTPDAVHQGICVFAEPLNDGEPKIAELGNLVVLLDEVTDPHNIGAIMRSASAFGATAVITTFRNSPAEGGVLAKSASGALEYIAYGRVRNLVKYMAVLSENNFTLIGLDGEAETEISSAFTAKRYAEKYAIVLGAEGKGLRGITKENCDILAKISMSERQESLNVSNAAAISLWEAQKHLALAS